MEMDSKGWFSRAKGWINHVNIESVLSTVIGLLGGVILSAFFWYFITHLIVPKVAFSEQITKRFTVDRKPVYELRVTNASRRRGIVDLYVTVLVISTGLKMFPGSRGTTTIVLPVSHYAHNILRLRPRKGFRVIRLDLDKTFQMADQHHRRLFSLDEYDPESKDALEYLLSQGENGSLVIEMLGYDEWSGSRKYFQSPSYKIEDIIHGQFDGLHIIRFVEPETNLIPSVQDDIRE